METREDISDQTFHFPDEILLEILNWLSLISDASFFPCYVSRSKDSPPFTLIFQCDNNCGMHGFVSNGNTLKNFSSPFPSDQIPGLKVEATSNDLILYRSNCHESVYFVANPFTRQCVPLPMHSGRRSYGSTGLISCVRNGITSYNVVRLIKHCDSSRFSNAQHSLNLETFSSEKGEWRNLKPKNCMFNVEFDARPCIVFKGVLHWICNRMTTLLAYDPCSSPDQCRFISIPNETYNMNGMNAVLGASGENLYYFEMSRISIQESKLPGWKLWVLKDHERGEWSLDQEGKERKIESLGVLCNVLSTYSPLLPVAFHPWNKDILYFRYEGYLLTFNVKTGWFEDKFSTFSSESMVSTWEIFPLLMPLSPTQIPHCRGEG
ncbi:hypothetical protein Pfo_023977 [Paulownia fortunei]|nr:hypothetical protein Pfo_023977 [Paulownia fortunei]